MTELYKPGQDNLPAGAYEEVGPDGEYVTNGRHTRIDQGDRLPPTSKAGNRWKKFNTLADGSDLHKPGTDNLPAGSYEEVGPRGGKVPHGRHASIDQGDRLPPTSKAGNRWKKVE